MRQFGSMQSLIFIIVGFSIFFCQLYKSKKEEEILKTVVL